MNDQKQAPENRAQITDDSALVGALRNYTAARERADELKAAAALAEAEHQEAMADVRRANGHAANELRKVPGHRVVFGDRLYFVKEGATGVSSEAVVILGGQLGPEVSS